MKYIITEGVSDRCKRSDVVKYKDIFNTNKYVKKIYRYGIEKILSDVFPDNYYKKDEYGVDQMNGIYDLEKPGRSVLNKINTNYEVFCVLINDINKVLTKLNRPTISFDGKSVKQQIDEAKKFIEIVNEFKKSSAPFLSNT